MLETCHAAWCVLADQQEEYEKVCRSVYERHANSSSAQTLWQLSLILSVGEQSTVLPQELVKLANRSKEIAPENIRCIVVT